jgi:hypothetical protein
MRIWLRPDEIGRLGLPCRASPARSVRRTS